MLVGDRGISALRRRRDGSLPLYGLVSDCFWLQSALDVLFAVLSFLVHLSISDLEAQKKTC